MVLLSGRVGVQEKSSAPHPRLAYIHLHSPSQRVYSSCRRRRPQSSDHWLSAGTKKGSSRAGAGKVKTQQGSRNFSARAQILKTIARTEASLMTSATNVAEVERWASAIGGAALAVYGMRQRSSTGAVLAASGGALIVRGATGYCPVYAASGVSTADDDTKRALAGPRGVNVDLAVTINKPIDQLYEFWRRLENLPRFMTQLQSVSETSPRRSHWIAKAPAGRRVEWDAEIINEIPNELIGWRTLPGADVVSAGSVRFVPAGAGRGTEVHVRLQYEPPAGKLGAVIAWLFGQAPAQTIREDLRRFKQLMEAGEAPTTEGQPRGRQSMLNYD
jgi:uncharacterized membrane protein